MYNKVNMDPLLFTPLLISSSWRHIDPFKIYTRERFATDYL
ncbi:hypothetical protein [Bacillus sp. NPDC077027]